MAITFCRGNIEPFQLMIGGTLEDIDNKGAHGTNKLDTKDSIPTKSHLDALVTTSQ